MSLLEDLGAKAITSQFNEMTPDQKTVFKAAMLDIENGAHQINVAMADDNITGDELNGALTAIYSGINKTAYRGVVGAIMNAYTHITG